MALDLPLLLGVGVYFVSSLGGVSIVKFLNYHFCFESWWIFALLSRSTWVLSFLLHLFLQRREHLWLAFSKRQLGLYLLVAVGLSMVELLNSFSMSMLPGSLYMLLKGSDVGWSMSLSYIMLNKRYNFCQIVAAGLIMFGIGLVFVVDIIYSRPDAADTDHTMMPTPDSFPVATAAVLCLLGALLNALCSVATEAMLKKTLQEEQERLLHEHGQSAAPSKLLLSNAYSMWTSFFSFCLLVVPVFIKESDAQRDHDQALTPLSNSSSSICPAAESNYHNTTDSSSIASSDTMHPSITTALSAGIVLSLILLGASRFLERLCKHFICVYDSAVTFSIVQAARRWLGIYIVGILFHEGFAKGMLVGSLVSGIGFVLHSQSSSKITTSKANSSSNGRTRSHAYEKVKSSDIMDDHDDLAGELEMPESHTQNVATIETIY